MKLKLTGITIHFDQMIIAYDKEIRTYIRTLIDEKDLKTIYLFSDRIEITFDVLKYDIESLTYDILDYIETITNHNKYVGYRIKSYKQHILEQAVDNGWIVLEKDNDKK